MPFNLSSGKLLRPWNEISPGDFLGGSHKDASLVYDGIPKSPSFSFNLRSHLFCLGASNKCDEAKKSLANIINLETTGPCYVADMNVPHGLMLVSLAFFDRFDFDTFVHSLEPTRTASGKLIAQGWETVPGSYDMNIRNFISHALNGTDFETPKFQAAAEAARQRRTEGLPLDGSTVPVIMSEIWREPSRPGMRHNLPAQAHLLQ